MYNLVVCAVFKNEAHILEEWILHYLHHGFEHIYLINDFSSDNYMDIINKYSENITLYHNDIIHGFAKKKQVDIYHKYFMTDAFKNSKWVAIFDLDEFLYSPSEINIKNIIDRYDDYNAILVDWVHFGSNGHILQPHSVVEGFTKRAPITTVLYNNKTIFKPDKLKDLEIHTTKVEGKTIHLKYSNESLIPPLILNHYNIQSKNFYLNVKQTRGDINARNVSRDIKIFKSYDNNDIRDFRLYFQNKAIVQKIKHNKLDLSNNDVTLVITSCNRIDLLDMTISSFIKYNTYPIKEAIIIDDSGKIGCNEKVLKKYKDKLNIISLYNNENISQIRSIDKAYSYIKTKYIFHCEEDWKFNDYSFIEKSMKIFDDNLNEKIFTVWLRSHKCTNGHPIIFDDYEKGYYKMDTNYNGKWHGMTFNPGLRKTTDMYLHHPYTFKCDFSLKNGKYDPMYPEQKVNNIYHIDGYYSVILDKPEGHVNHIGWGRSTDPRNHKK